MEYVLYIPETKTAFVGPSFDDQASAHKWFIENMKALVWRDCANVTYKSTVEDWGDYTFLTLK